jgi:hypothetical protein
LNVGTTAENYQIRDVAELVREAVPGSRITFAGGASADPRSYRVSCNKLAAVLPDFQFRWNVRRGAEQLRQAFERFGFTAETFAGDRYFRLRRIRTLQNAAQLDADLRWRSPVPEGARS